MAIALVAALAVSAPSANGGTSVALDTTGATLLIVSVSWASNPATLSDSKGNVWTGLTERTAVFDHHRLYYCLAPTVGPGHTVTVTGTSIVAGWHVYAFSGVGSYQTESGTAITGGGPGSAICGSVTPSANGALIFTGLCAVTGPATDSVTPGFLPVSSIVFVTGAQVQASAAYQIQATAAAINPIWSWTGPHDYVCVGVAVFLPSVGPALARSDTYVWGPL